MPRFRLTLSAPVEYGVNTFDTDPDLWTESNGAESVVDRFEDDPIRDSVMRIKGVSWMLGDDYDLGDGLCLDDSPLGVDEGAYYDAVVVPEVLYSFSCLYKIELGTLDLTFWDVTNDVEIETVELDDIEAWIRYECNILVPVDCVSVRITFSQPVEHAGPFYIDDVSMSGNMILNDPDNYFRTPQRAGSFHKSLDGARVYDLNVVHYTFKLKWNFVDATQYENFKTLMRCNELVYFDDGDVPELTEDIDLDETEIIDLSHKAIVDVITGDVVSVKNIETGYTLELTTEYTIATDGRSVTLIGQTLGDTIRITYKRYFEVMFLAMPEEWLGGRNDESITRKVILEMETLADE